MNEWLLSWIILNDTPTWFSKGQGSRENTATSNERFLQFCTAQNLRNSISCNSAISAPWRSDVRFFSPAATKKKRGCFDSWRMWMEIFWVGQKYVVMKWHYVTCMTRFLSNHHHVWLYYSTYICLVLWVLKFLVDIVCVIKFIPWVPKFSTLKGSRVQRLRFSGWKQLGYHLSRNSRGAHLCLKFYRLVKYYKLPRCTYS